MHGLFKENVLGPLAKRMRYKANEALMILEQRQKIKMNLIVLNSMIERVTLIAS